MMCLLVFTCYLVHICSYMVCLYTSYLGCNSNTPRVYQHYVSTPAGPLRHLWRPRGKNRWHTKCTNFSATPTACTYKTYLHNIHRHWKAPDQLVCDAGRPENSLLGVLPFPLPDLSLEEEEWRV